MNIPNANTFGMNANSNSNSVTPQVNVNNNEWKTVNVSNNVMKPITRVQQSSQGNLLKPTGNNMNVNNNQPRLQSNLNENVNVNASSNIKPKVVSDAQGQGKVVDFRQQLTTTKKKK